MSGISKKDARRIVEAAEAQGCRIVKRKDGLTLRHPDGVTTFSLHWTTSDHRAASNLRAAFRRARLTWPFD